MTMTSIHQPCGRTVQFVMPRQMGIGSITCDPAKFPQPERDDDVWARYRHQEGGFWFECPPGEVGAARYRLHRCQERAA